MVAAAAAALTIYDMVKGAERGVEIRGGPAGGEARRQERLVDPVWKARATIETDWHGCGSSK